jgi:DNA-binding response OmpR family regulator
MIDQSSSVAMSLMHRFLRAKGLTLDLFERTVLLPTQEAGSARHEQQVVELTNTEFKLLYCFMASPDAAHSRNYLLKAVWNLENSVGSNRVEVAVHQLRCRIGAHFILCLRGSGYMLGTGCPCRACARGERCGHPGDPMPNYRWDTGVESCP